MTMTGIQFALRTISPADHRVMQWKNGGGTTTEIAIDPPDANVGGRFRWRLSIATVERSCPFSAFPGYDRTIAVIEGRGMDLAVGSDPARRIDRLFEPFVFSGDWPAECRLLDGPIRDFNLMVDRTALWSRLDIVQLGAASRPTGPDVSTWVVHCFEGVLDIRPELDSWSSTLPPGHTAVIGPLGPGLDTLRLQAPAGHSASVAIVELRPV